MRQNFPRLHSVFTATQSAIHTILVLAMLGIALPAFGQNPFVIMQVDTADQNHPIKVFLEANPRSDVASISIIAEAPTNIASLSIVDPKTLVGFPIGENGIGVSALSDTGFIPRQGMALVHILTDNSTLKQRFSVRFHGRNGETLYEQLIPIDIHPRTRLAPPCNRNILDLTTGVTTSAMLLGANVIDGNWSTTLNNVTGPRPTTASTVYTLMSPSYWDSPSSSSRWLCYQQGSATSTPGLPNGFWTSWRQFCVGRDSTRVTITLNARADDAAQVFLVPPTGGADIPLGSTSGFSGTLTPIIDTRTLSAGTYYIRVVTQNMGGGPTAFRFEPGSSITAIGSSSSNLGLTGTACCKAPGRVFGRKVWDKNCSGKIDGGDAPLGNWVITATPTAGGTPITATTDALGNYSLQLFEGTYNITETMQSGWNPSVSAGPYTVTVLSGQSYVRNFLNCKKPTCEELFTVGETDSVCCRGNFSISTEPGVTVTSLSFAVTGGVLTGAFSGCPSSNSLNFTGGLTSGTLLYPTGCNNMNMEFNAKSTTAHGRVCVRWTATFKQGTQTFTCFKDICINCERMPKECGANPTVVPAAFPPVNTDYREFTVNANKLSVSQISHIDIKFVNEPTPAHIGGGLRVSASTPYNRNWTFANSNAYNQIRLGCTTPITIPHGAAASNFVKFNLGVDNTINYNGIVQIKVGFCDGDTCEYTYDWRTNSTTALPSNIDTATMFANPRLLRMAVKTPERTRSVSFKVGDSTTTIRGITPPCADIENCPDVKANFRVVAQSNSAVMIFGDGSCDSANTKACLAPENFIVNLLYSGLGKTNGTIPVEVRYFDANGAQIGISTKELKSSVTSVITQPGFMEYGNDVQLKGITPNPVEHNATLDFFIMESASNATATLLDIQGREVQTILQSQRLDAGSHRASFDTSLLANGVYILKLTVDGTIKTTKFTVAH